MALMRNIRSLFNGDFWICEIHTGSVPAVSNGSYNHASCGRGGGGRKFSTLHAGIFLNKEFPHPHCQHETLFRGCQLGAPPRVCFCSLLTGKGDTRASLTHLLVLAALVLLTFILAALSGPRHKQQPGCATFALKAEEKDNLSLRRLWLRMSLSNILWGSWDFEIGVRGGTAEPTHCLLLRSLMPGIKLSTTLLGWLECEMPTGSLDLRMLGHVLAATLGCSKESLVWSRFCARNDWVGWYYSVWRRNIWENTR